MIEWPAFAPQWDVTLVPGEALCFVSSREDRTLDGPVFEALAPLIDGRRHADDIASRLARRFPPEVAYWGMLVLERGGYLVDALHTPLGEPVSVDALERLARVATARAAGSVRCVAVVDDYLDITLSPINRRHLRTRHPWMLIRGRADQVWIGPLFRPGLSACWKCLAWHRAVARPLAAYLASRGKTSIVIARAARATTGVVHRVREILASGDYGSPVGRVLVYDAALDTMEAFAVARRLDCRACGERNPVRWIAKAVTSPAPHLKPLAAIAAHLANPVTGLAAGVHKVRAVPYDAFHVYTAKASQSGLVRASPWLHIAGSGLNDEQARFAALGEAVERWSQSAHGDESRIHASLCALGERAVDPNTCMLFSARQYRSRRAWNSHGDPGCRVPRPFDSRRRIDWTPVRSLMRDEERLLPTAMLYLESSAAGHDMCVADTNGCAAGDTFNDAVLRGFLELIERDSIALWWYTRKRRPALDLASVQNSYYEDLASAYRALGREYWLLDLTTDTGVPCCAAISRRTGGAPEEIVLGFGAHFCGEHAAAHAVAEMNQMIALLAASDGPVEARLAPPVLRAWLANGTLDAQSYLVPEDGAAIGFADRPAMVASSGTEPLARVCKIVEQLGADIWTLDLTRPETGVPVVKVIVPGLRPAAPRFAPGRLFDAPVHMGWRSQSLAEEELNAIPCFF